MRPGPAAAAALDAALAAAACTSAAPRVDACDRLVELAARVVACDQLAAAPRDKVEAGRKQLAAALAELATLGGARVLPADQLEEVRATCAEQDATHRATYAKLAPTCFE